MGIESSSKFHGDLSIQTDGTNCISNYRQLNLGLLSWLTSQNAHTNLWMSHPRRVYFTIDEHFYAFPYARVCVCVCYICLLLILWAYKSVIKYLHTKRPDFCSASFFFILQNCDISGLNTVAVCFSEILDTTES